MKKSKPTSISSELKLKTKLTKSAASSVTKKKNKNKAKDSKKSIIASQSTSSTKNKSKKSKSKKNDSYSARNTQSMGLDYKRFLGLSLSGPKNDKTSICALDFYPDQQKLMFSMLLTGIGADDDVSGDQWLLEIIKQQSKVELLAMDVPLQLPKCMRCELQCPGYENCQLAPIQWLWSNYNENKQKKRKTRIFAPYMERCVEYYLATQLEQDFHLPSSLGSNAAPLTARAHYLMKHIDSQCKEVSTALSIWRIGKRLSVPQKYLKYFPLSENADECRLEFLKALMKQDLVFIYNQDAQLMVENPQAFHAFICAYTMYLEFTGQCEKPPKDFPKDEVWLSFPKI